MLTAACPKLPMRVKTVTKDFYIQQLGFQEIGFANFESYMILKKDEAELHFFIFLGLIPEENYGQVYIRVNHIEQLYQELVDRGVPYILMEVWQKNLGVRKNLLYLILTIT